MITNVAPMAFQLEQDRCTCFKVMQLEGFPGGTMVKNLPANAGDAKDTGLIPESGRSPGGGNGNAFQYSCLGSPDSYNPETAFESLSANSEKY